LTHPTICWKERLLPPQVDRKFAVANPGWQILGIARGRVLAVGRDELCERREQRGLRQAVLIDAVETGFGPGLPQIAQRALLLLVLGNRLDTRPDASPCSSWSLE